MQARALSTELDDKDFGYFQRLIRDLAGIHLSDNKRDLVQTRLRARMAALGLASLTDYRKFLETKGRGDDEVQRFINSLTTNKTDWFREPAHFDYLVNTVLPKWKDSGTTKPKIWSAASSTGEEPYTISMVLNRHLPAGFDYEILATDIDTSVLTYARNGVYELSRLEQMPDDGYKSNFVPGRGEIDRWMKLKSAIKNPVTFQRFNLATDPAPAAEKFDLIFCRNVLIYFPKEVIANVAQKLYTAARPGAFLFIGHSETLQMGKASWRYVRPSIYAKDGE